MFIVTPETPSAMKHNPASEWPTLFSSQQTVQATPLRHLMFAIRSMSEPAVSSVQFPDRLIGQSTSYVVATPKYKVVHAPDRCSFRLVDDGNPIIPDDDQSHQWPVHVRRMRVFNSPWPLPRLLLSSLSSPVLRWRWPWSKSLRHFHDVVRVSQVTSTKEVWMCAAGVSCKCLCCFYSSEIFPLFSSIL